MYLLILFFAELFILNRLAKRIQGKLMSTFLGMTKRKNWAVYMTAFLFIPGTFFHEISHFLSALFLLVPVGDLKVIPEIKDDEIRLGSVGIGKSDPVRRFLIGIAPFVFGTLTIFVVIHLTVTNNLFENFWTLLLIGYVVFQIGNTMFSSRKDLEGALGLLIFLIIIYLLLFLLGVNINFTIVTNLLSIDYMKEILEKASVFMLLPIILDLMILFLIKFFHV